jgi:glutathione S-transferase/RNA polymerase-associated protein
MRPVSAEERARVRMLEDTLDTIYEGVTWAVFEIEGWGRATGELKTTLLKRAAEQIAQFNGWLERELGSRTWFNGDAFGWGDACAYPFVAGAAGQGNAPRAGSKLAAWLARVMERPSVKRCIDDIGAVQVGMGVEVLQGMLKSGLFKREYRDHRLEWMMRSGGVSIVLEGMQKNNIRFSNEPA